MAMHRACQSEDNMKLFTKKTEDEHEKDPGRVRVRVVHLNEDEDEESAVKEPPAKRGRNTELSILTWYNSKQDTSSDRIIRGSIITENGTVLASTQVDYTGNEIRSYPYANIFAHTVGYATNGKAGLEASGNSILMGSHSSLLNQLKNARDSQKVRGDSLIVTLRPDLQQAAYYALGGFNGAVVVMEPDSGRILAMVSKPDFDPGSIAWTWEDMVGDSSSSALLNRASQGLYPPGSTFKILTALAYLRQQGNAYDDFLYDCTGILER